MFAKKLKFLTEGRGYDDFQDGCGRHTTHDTVCQYLSKEQKETKEVFRASQQVTSEHTSDYVLFFNLKNVFLGILYPINIQPFVQCVFFSPCYSGRPKKFTN